MKIVQVNDNDLNGRIYNGHDLQLSLNECGVEAWQIVAEKFGKEPTTVPLLSKGELGVRRQLTEFERNIGMINLLEPFANKMTELDIFKQADVVHYHIIHNQVISLLDLPHLTELKPSVWTIHDPWIISGHCIYPLECEKWKTGCDGCANLSRPFCMEIDKAKDIWKIKKQVFSKMNLDLIVSTDWMRDYLIESPLTRHLTRIHKIPFGLKLEKYDQISKKEARKKLEINESDIVISFRAEDHIVKGLKYIVEALEYLSVEKEVTILTVGTAKLPKSITDKYHTIELGWQREEGVITCLTASDIFLMPSLAESFGLMAIEAMAANCAVVTFKDTVLEQVTFAPQIGVAVSLKDSFALKDAIKNLILNDKERYWRIEEGRRIVEKCYSYSDYIHRHIEVYEEIIERNKSSRKEFTINNVGFNKEVKEGLEKIYQLKRQIRAYSYNKAKKICIFCAGKYGKQLYIDLRARMIKVDLMADSDEKKWGYFFIENGSKSLMDVGVTNYVTQEKEYPAMSTIVECISPEQLECDKDDVLVIVANKKPMEIMNNLKKRGFPYVIEKSQIDQLLDNVPGIEIFGLGKLDGGKFEELKMIDYSNKGVQCLINSFNRILNGVCQFYENSNECLKK